MATITNDLLMEDAVVCRVCEDEVPRGHTVLRADLGRVCWFCHTDEVIDGPDDSDFDDDWDDYDDWD